VAILPAVDFAATSGNPEETCHGSARLAEVGWGGWTQMKRKKVDATLARSTLARSTLARFTLAR